MHNAKVMKPKKEGDTKDGCNCRKTEECPVGGHCLMEGVVYQATVECEGESETYIGMTGTNFKTRWRNHTSTFRNTLQRNSTVIAKHIWDLEEANREYSLKWRIVARARTYNHVSDTCRLCLREKFFIIYKPEMSSLNSRSEIAGHCPHKLGQLLLKS